MGVTQSKTSVDVVNEAIASIIVKVASSGVASGQILQKQTMSGVGIGSTYSQEATVDLKALQTFKMDANIAQEMANVVKQVSDAQGGLLQGTFANDTTAIRNYLMQNIQNDTIQECGASLIASQLQEAGGIQAFVTAKQKASVVASCIQSTLNENNISQKLVNDVDQKVTAEGESISGTLKYLIMAGVGVTIAIIVAIIIIMLLRRSKTSKTQKAFGGKRKKHSKKKRHSKRRHTKK